MKPCLIVFLLDNVPEKKLCEDGLLFDTSNPNLEKCDLPFSVDCGDRTELRKQYLEFIRS